MYNTNRILAEFKEIVGYRESANSSSCYTPLTTSLKESDSCKYVNDLSGVNMEVINQCYGSDYSSTNDYLLDVRHQSILSAMDEFIRNQKSNIKTKELLKNASLGITVDNIRDYVIPRNRFVGYEFRPKLSNSVSISLFQLGLQFSDPVTDFPIYFYCSSKLDPIEVFYVTTTNYGMNWITLANTTSGSGSESASCEVQMDAVIAEYISETHNTGDRYWLGYYESDLALQNTPTVKAVKTNVPCQSCGGRSISYSLYADIQPIEVSTGLYQSREVFDADKVGYSSETFGMNLKLNVKCDYTSLILQNKLMFTDLILYKSASKILWDAYNSNRLNSTQNTKKEDFRLMAEKYQVDFEDCLKSLEVDFSCLDPACIGKRNSSFAYVGL